METATNRLVARKRADFIATVFRVRPPLRAALRRLGGALFFCALALPARAQFTPTSGSGGVYEYYSLLNWVGGLIGGINGQFTSTTPSGTIVTLKPSLFSTLSGLGLTSSGLSFNQGPSATLTLRGDGNFTYTLGGDITVSGTNSTSITLGSTTAGENLNFNLNGNRTFTAATGNTLTLINVISGSGNSLTINGNGTVILNGVNTYTGGTTIDSAIVQVVADSALGTGALTLTKSATLKFGGTFTSTRNISLGTLGGVIDTNGFSGSISGIISGVTGLTIKGNGTGSLTLTGANTYTGGTTLNASSSLTVGAADTLPTSGSVTLGSGARLNVNYNQTIGTLSSTATTSGITIASGKTLNVGGTATTSFDGVIDGAGAFKKSGTGSLTLSGANSYFGGTTIAGGTLVITDDTNLGDVSGGITFNGGTLKLAGALYNSRDLTLSTSGGTIDTNGFESQLDGMITGTGGLTLQGAGKLILTSSLSDYTGGTTVQSGGLLDINDDANLGVTNSNVTLNDGTLKTSYSITNFTHALAIGALGGAFDAGDYNSTITGQITGTGRLSVLGTSEGRLTLDNAANSWSGGLTVDSFGTVAAATDGALGAVPGSAVANSIILDNGTLFSTATFTLNANRGITLGAGGGTFKTDTGTTLTYGGIIAGAGTLLKKGDGVLTLTNSANTWSGRTTVQAGTISFGTDGALGAVPGSTLVNSITLDAGILQTTGTFALNAARGITLYGGGGTIETAASTTLTYAGLLTNDYFGSGDFTKAGAGTLILTADQTGLSSSIFVNGGTLQLGNGGASGGTDSNIEVSSGATLVTKRSDDSTYSGILSGAGAYTKDGAGNLTLMGQSTFTGTATLSAGTLTVGAWNALPTTSELALASSTILELQASQTISQILSSSGSAVNVGYGTIFTIAPGSGVTSTGFAGAMNIDGFGSLALSATNGSFTFTNTGTISLTTGADVTIGSGVTFSIGNGGTTGSVTTTANIVNNGVLAFNRSGEYVSENYITGTGSVTNYGVTSLRGASNSYSGGTSVASGILSVNNSAGSATGSGAVTVSNGATFGGTGSITGDLSLSAGGIVSPGDIHGGAGAQITTLTVGSATFNGGGQFKLEFTDGAPGSIVGDLLSISGALTLNNTSGSPFVINLVSLDYLYVPGTLSNFDAGQAGSWQFVTAGSITGFDANAFQVNVSQFQNSLLGGSFYVTSSGTSLALNFTPVPEPSTWVMLGLGLVPVAIAVRRRRVAR